MKLKIVSLTLGFLIAGAGTERLYGEQAPPVPGGTPTLTPAATTTPAAAPATPPAPTSGPKIAFETPVYDFGKVKSGEPVKHTFIFTNVGTEVLILTNVQPSCGCTTAGEWTKQVEPGKTGTIPIQFNSANYGGQVMKTVTVTSNDKSTPSFGLQLKGTVWKPIDVQPQFAVMNIPPDTQSNITTRVHIVNNMEDQITLSAPESSVKAFTAQLKTNNAGKDFDLIISANPPFESNVQGAITMKTSSTNVPTISVTAWANVQQAVVVSPPQVMLGAPPLANKQTVSVMIQNNGSAPLKVTDPKVDTQGIEVQLSEPVPGRSFTATLTFPQGFELAQGTKAELTLNSNNPKFAVIKVPINQMPKPALAAPVHPGIVPLSPPPAPASAATSKTAGK